jgi:diguanylate cyclase (GGDEF)-like protein
MDGTLNDRAAAQRNDAPRDARRIARRAWNVLHEDPAKARTLAQRALDSALHSGDPLGQAQARLAIGFHLLYFATPAEASVELTLAQQQFEAEGDRAGAVLAATGLARAHWRAGRVDHALACVLPLRDEGVRVLSGSQRGVLLNTIAGCYSALEQSEQAFAYMYQALRDARPMRARGYDTFLHCNLAHELLQLGDFHEALRHVDQGLEGCARLKNPRLLGVLLVNRIIVLTELGRAREALPDIERVCALPAGPQGRGALATHYETMALAAFQCGENDRACELVDQALHELHAPIPDEHVELALAKAMRAEVMGDREQALRELDQAQAWFDPGTSAASGGASLRARCLFWNSRAGLLERMGRTADALVSLRHWQRLYTERADLASRARYQAAALQTELLRLQHRLDENDARRRATERARAELETANLELSRKVREVQALQAALREQAVRDELTGLFNRRRLNEALPAMLSLAQRDGTPVALVMIDLDHFKAVNDVHGHEAGDRVLAAFGLLLARSCRKSDVACRWGGEEFCLLMAQTSAATALRKVRSLLRRWHDTRLHIGEAVIGELSFSAGVADTVACGHFPGTLLAAADAELLLAKSAGRGRVRVRTGTSASAA